MPRVLAIALCFALVAVWVSRPAAQTAAAAAAAPVGVIAGTVLDKATGDPIIDAGVEIVETKKTVRTDIDGKFAVKVPPGKYTVRFFAPLYQGARTTNVNVVANQTATADAILAPEGDKAVEVVEVTATAAKAAEATQLIRRQKADVVSDTISAETIAKAPDSSAAEIVERVPAVVVTRDGRPVIRGLPDRYSFAILNGSRLPSTDPDSRVISLELFPADFLDSINIIKSYTPDLPGDFAGGLIDLELKEFPEQLTYGFGISTGGNTETTFQDFETYDGSKWDWAGYGAQMRDLPSIFGSEPLADRKPPTAQQRELVSTLSNVWNVETVTAPPQFGMDFNIGNSFGPLGLTFNALYDNKYQEHQGEFLANFQNKNTREDPVISLRESSTYDHGTFTTTLGALAGAGYKLGTNHKFALRGLVNLDSENDTFKGLGGESENEAEQDIFQNVLQYEQERLGFGQLTGESKWDVVEVDWRTALSQTTQEIPDARFVRYIQTPGGTLPVLSPKQPSLLRVFQNLDEYLTDSALDGTVPFKTQLPWTDVWSGMEAKFKTGLAYSYRKRNFLQRQFLYDFPNKGFDPTQSPEVVLRPPFIGDDRDNGQFQFTESTLPRDQFTASQEIAAVYGMFDLPLLQDRLRLIAGVREEYSFIRLQGFDFSGVPVTRTLNDLDPIPGVNLVYTPLDDMNVRYGYSRTVSRPDFRELTPSELPPPLGGRTVRGNPNLVSGTIDSQDLRWEWFFAPNELVSLGFFYKDFTDPIEKIALSTTSQSLDSFKNANEATNYGVEFELRKNLGFLAPEPAEGWRAAVAEQAPFFNFITNVTWINSEVDVTPDLSNCDIDPNDPDCALVSTNFKRPLQGQAPFIVNAIVEYDNPDLFTARLLYNTIGSYIDAAGVDGLPDIFVDRRNQLDALFSRKVKIFDVPLKLKVAAENLLNEDFLETEGGEITERWNDGVAFSVGLSYSF